MDLPRAAALVVSVLLGLISALLLLRILLQALRADPFHPLSRALRDLFAPVLNPLARLVPPWRGIHFAAILLLLALQSLRWLIVGALQGHAFGVGALVLLGLYGTIDLTLSVLFWTIILAILLSFLAPQGDNPLVPIARALAEPLLQPFRRLLPPTGPLDFSPVLAILTIELLRLLVARPLYEAAIAIG
jgi:YggT family protein